MDQQFCPFCKFPISFNFRFCPNCGKQIQGSSVSTTITKQIGLYAISIFLPPLGLWPGIKYILQKDQKAKIIGAVAISLTILSTIITTMLTINLFNQLNNTLTIMQKVQYQNLGY